MADADTEAAFLADIANDPEDDFPRLIFADWLSDRSDPARSARGEFIRGQCEIARPEAGVRHETVARTLTLLREYGNVWKDNPPSDFEVRFERGLLAVEASDRAFHRPGAIDWWQRHRRWVMRLLLSPCDDHRLDVLAQDALGPLPELSLGLGVTDRGLACLAGLSHLRSLNLMGLRVTDTGVAHLSSLTGLRELFLLGPGVTSAGLVSLAGMTELRTLILHCPGVTDAGLAHLTGCQQLRALHLSETRVTDRGLAFLVTLPELGWLDLNFTRVTNDGLEYLRQIKHLRGVTLLGTDVTESGLTWLREALPTVQACC